MNPRPLGPEPSALPAALHPVFHSLLIIWIFLPDVKCFAVSRAEKCDGGYLHHGKSYDIINITQANRGGASPCCICGSAGRAPERRPGVLETIQQSRDASAAAAPEWCQEHVSHEAEVALCRALGDTASRNAEVLSLRNLSGRVLGEVGGLPDFTLDGGGKLLTMRMALQEVGGSLRVFNNPSAEKQQQLRGVCGASWWRVLVDRRCAHWRDTAPGALCPGWRGCPGPGGGQAAGRGAAVRRL